MPQGAANGVGQPLAMSTMFNVFPPERRGTAIGIYGLFCVLSPTFGPIVGGIAIDSISWRYLFIPPLPFYVPALRLGLVFMPGKKLAARFPPFDWAGLGLALLIPCSLLGGLANGPRMGWNADFVVYRLAAAAGMLCIFIYWELRAPHPLLDLSLFRNRQFALTMAPGGKGSEGAAMRITEERNAPRGLVLRRHPGLCSGVRARRGREFLDTAGGTGHMSPAPISD
jgi:MFS family permease